MLPSKRQASSLSPPPSSPKRLCVSPSPTTASILSEILSTFANRRLSADSNFRTWLSKGDHALASHPIPPLSDPYLWHFYINNTYEKQGLPLLQDEWHVEELRGDKYFALLTTTLLRTYHIPHSVANIMASVLLSNEYQGRIARQQGIVVNRPNNKKGEASALEVYFGCLQNDPLYLYSEKTVDEHCTDFLQGIWAPFFQYISSEYGPPRQLDGLDCSEFLSNEATVSAKNWVYAVPKEYDMKSSSVYEYLISMIKTLPGVKNGFTCLLKVSVPARETHPFWRLDPAMKAEYKLFIWDMAEEALEFEVCLWGLDDDNAKFNGTCRAKDIIRNIRSQLNPPQPYTKPLQNEVLHALEQEQECEVLYIGKLLNYDWRYAADAFHFIAITKEGGFAKFGYNKISSLRPSSPLLQYYSVFSSHIALTIDIFPD